MHFFYNDRTTTFLRQKTKRLALSLGVLFLAGCASNSTRATTAPTLPANTAINPAITPVHNPSHDHNHEGHDHEIPKERAVGTLADFSEWLRQTPWQQAQVAQYEQFLFNHLGKYNTPPLHQLLTTARSWQECGYDPYQVPPTELWHNMLPTLKLYAKLRQLGILPPNTEIRSVYRNPDLNRCAGGATGSKHLTNGAIDIWVPTYHKDSWQMKDLQNRLCQFWIGEGQSHAFGLGIYATGAIHLDTQGYRKWGGEHTEYGSPCRYILPKPENRFEPAPVVLVPTAQSAPAKVIPMVEPPTPPAQNPLAVFQSGQTTPNFATPAQQLWQLEGVATEGTPTLPTLTPNGKTVSEPKQ